MSKHSPTPWEVGDDGISTASLGDRIHVETQCQEADERLIAAAPDLLEACKEAAAWLESGANGDAWALAPAKTLRAAISRAEGRA